MSGPGQLERDPAGARANLEDRPWIAGRQLAPQRQVRAVGAALEVVPHDFGVVARGRRRGAGAMGHAQPHALFASPRATSSSRSASIAV